MFNRRDEEGVERGGNVARSRRHEPTRLDGGMLTTEIQRRLRLWVVLGCLMVALGVLLMPRDCGGGSSEPVEVVVEETAVPIETRARGTRVVAVVATARPVATVIPTRTAVEQVGAIETWMEEGRYDDVVGELEGMTSRDPALDEMLAVAHIEKGDGEAAIDLLTAKSSRERMQDDTNYWLGVAFAEEGDCQNAAASWSLFASWHSELAGYMQGLTADCYEANGGGAEAQISALEGVRGESVSRRYQFFKRARLAMLYLDVREYEAAHEEYLYLRQAARMPYSQGQMGYLAGLTAILAGKEQAGYAIYNDVVTRLPDHPDAIKALNGLVDEGIPVDGYAAGQVQFFAGAFEDCVNSLVRYLEDAESPQGGAYIMLANCYEAADEPDEAIAIMDSYSELGATPKVNAQMTSAAILGRENQENKAVRLYEQVVEEAAWSDRAPEALMAAAELADDEKAIELYQRVVDEFPNYNRADEALYRAGALSEGNERVALWDEAAEQYAGTTFGRRALLGAWDERPNDPNLFAMAKRVPQQAEFYATRLDDRSAGREPFESGDVILEDDFDEKEAGLWMAQFNGGASPDTQLPTGVRSSAGFMRGERLLALRLFDEAWDEFEAVRDEFADEPIVQYQFAIFYSEVGLYKGSIRAATDLMRLTESTPYNAPSFIASLAYPVAFRALIGETAEKYNIDPLLLFALIRQESLFESGAQSPVSAQGLAQVMPATGEYIAGKIGMSEFDTADLYQAWLSVEMGGYYLAEQLNGFDQIPHVALAAYNAGPGRAIRWYGASGAGLDEFIEAIEFAETYSYVERIYVSYGVYRYLYGK